MAALLATMRHNLGKALRETGTAMDRAGMAFANDLSFWDHLSRHTTTVGFEEKSPSVAATACVAPSALAVVSLPRSRGGGVLLRAMSDLSAVDYAPRRPPTSPLAHSPFQRTQHWLR